MNLRKTLREWLSEQEHIQWESWSMSLAKEMWNIRRDLDEARDYTSAIKKIDLRLENWKKNWKQYKKLPEDIKDYDRKWADKILDNLPFKCPVDQCGGGVMVAKERPYPNGKCEDDFPDGMAGDYQLPDLICTNCKAVYRFDGFKNRRKLYKPEVTKRSLSHKKQERGTEFIPHLWISYL